MFFAGQDDENEIVTENTAFVPPGEPAQDASGPPKVDSEVEILQEKVTKQIIKEGHGYKTSKYSTCFCEYQKLVNCCFSSFFGHAFSQLYEKLKFLYHKQSSVIVIKPTYVVV